jgi:polyhydroxyalkanoate synthesis repressor PhaR
MTTSDNLTSGFSPTRPGSTSAGTSAGSNMGSGALSTGPASGPSADSSGTATDGWRGEAFDRRPHSKPSTRMNTAIARNPDVVHIRKYPNRRLYDTSQSRHLTHDGVIEIVNAGRTVQVTDSRSGEDITTIVLLQILIERDPAKLQAVPAELLHRAMRSEPSALRDLATKGIAAWRGTATSGERVDNHVAARPAPTAAERPMPARPAMPTNGVSHANSAPADNGRPKAKPKRLD